MICDTFGNVIFSQASAVGALPQKSPNGPKTWNYGQARPHASRLASRANSKVSKTNATFGPIGSDLFKLDGPALSWPNKFRPQFRPVGSIKSRSTWKRWVTPLGRQLFQLARSAHGTSETGFGLLPTPSGTNKGRNHNAGRLDEWGGRTNPFRGKTDGALHCPAFELWLMGFPETWAEQMPQETRLFRKSRPK